MLTYTEHVKNIVRLAEQSKAHVQEEKLAWARDDLLRISIHSNEAMKLIDEMSLLKRRGADPDKKIGELCQSEAKNG